MGLSHQLAELPCSDFKLYLKLASIMATLMSFSDYSDYRSVSVPRHSHTQAANTPTTNSTSTIHRPLGSARSADHQHPVMLPTPPASNHPSLEKSTEILASTASHSSRHHRVCFSCFPSCKSPSHCQASYCTGHCRQSEICH